ncbi:N-acetylglucosamine-6-phosphate deacetylase [candidate division KSB1 bacterium]
MTRTLYRSSQIILKDSILNDGGVVVENGTISALLEKEEAAVSTLNTVSGPWKYILPGFIDLHVQGTAGFDIWSADPVQIGNLAKTLLRLGVTSFLATTEYRPTVVETVVQTIEDGVGEDHARIAGIHLEGPFINPARRGAIPEDVIQPPDKALLREIIDRCGGHLRMMTLAPEMPGAMELIPILVEGGIVPTVGHSEASYRDLTAAADLGLSHACHLFNAMGPINHREPGTAGGCLLLDSISVQLIADGIHLHPDIFKLALKLKPVGGAVLITDAVKAAGLGDGDYDMMGEPIKVREGRVTDRDGRLAGSVVTMPEALGNAMRFAGLDLVTASRLTSDNPADVLGDSRRGIIAPDMAADLVFVDDDLKILRVMKAGRLIEI